MAEHASHERNERTDRCELAGVQENEFLPMRHGQQTNHVTNEKIKVRVCLVLQMMYDLVIEH